jgi:nicotinamidase-related amidase
MKDLLLVVDMQNVYRPDEEWACPGFPDAAAHIRSLLDSPLCGTKFDVIFTVYEAASDPVGCWKDYNEIYREINEDTRLAQIDATLAPYLQTWPLYRKSTYSSLSIPEIAQSLGKYDSVVLSGVVAECCIVSTALALIDAGAHVIYLSDAVAGQNAGNEAAICRLVESFAPIHTEVCSTEAYLARIKNKSCNIPVGGI